MKVTLFMAISVNGMIARQSYAEDFLSNENWVTFVQLAHKTGCIVWGRKTHELISSEAGDPLHDIKDVIKVVVSGDPHLHFEGVEVASSPEAAISKLKERGIQEVLLVGGSMLNSSFGGGGFIDEIILNIEPVIVGKGIPLFAPQEFDIKLRFVEMKKVTDGIIQLHYLVQKQG